MSKNKTTSKKRFPLVIGIIICFTVVFASAFGIMWILNHNNEPVPEPDVPMEPIPEPTPEPEPEPVLPNAIDFQPTIDSWVNSVGGNRSVIIYDLDRDELAGQYNPSEDYNMASLYKLFVVYEGYRRLERGEWSADAPAGYTGHTILECLDLAIRESHSPCAESLWGMIGHAELDAIAASDFGVTNSDISHIISNPTDILKIMQIFYKHADITNEVYLARIKDSFLNQPVTTYNWRQGLPSGFSSAVNVYNKVGWDFNPDGNYWNIYHDTAIVEFPEYDRHFIVVVMTNRVPFQKIREFGSLVEASVKESF